LCRNGVGGYFTEGDIALVIEEKNEFRDSFLKILDESGIFRIPFTEFMADICDASFAIDKKPCCRSQFIQFDGNEFPACTGLQ
jgi:hypothetical protein